MDLNEYIEAVRDRYKNGLSSEQENRGANSPSFDVRGELYRMCGVDLTVFDGTSDTTALKVIAGTGTEYVDQGQDYYEQQYQGRVMENLRRRAAEMGFALALLPGDNGSTSEISMT